MKFETIKENAKQLYAGHMNNWDTPQNVYAHNPLQKGSGPAFDALLPFILATKAEREEMREFADAFEAKPADWLALSAKQDSKGSAWNRVVLRAREAGLQLIDGWDVRQVGKLIELFPTAVPARMRNKPLTCYMADNEDCDWMVDVVRTEPQENSHG